MTTRETWLVLGGSSAVARAFARQLAREGADVVMAGRDQEDLARSVGDLVACYEGNASAFSFDAANDEDRTHLALAKETPAGRVAVSSSEAGSKVIVMPRLGGLHHRYDLAA